MDEPAEPEGMGPSPTGPGFTPWQQSRDSGSTGQSAGSASGEPTTHPSPDARSFAPRRSRLPGAITMFVVVLVAAVVLTATLVAERRDTQIGGLTVAPTPSRTVAPLREDSIEISSSVGSGRLVIVDHHWTTAGREAPRTGTTLVVEVELLCTSGEISFDPYFFQAFDQTGRLFEVMPPVPVGSLETGTLGPAEKVQGSISFDIPRGQVTLLMTDEGTQSVTALKIPD